MWEPQLAELSPEFHCLAPDLPEHGCSFDAGPLTISGAASQVAELIRRKAHGGVAHIVGLSLGAQIGVELLAQAPELLRSAILSSPILRPILGAGILSNDFLLRLTYWTALAPFKHWDAYVRLNMKYSAGIPEGFFGPFREAFQQTTADSWSHLIRANQTYRQPAGLDRVKLPVLVLAGQQEYAAMRASARDLAAALPNACLRRVSHTEKWALAEEHNWSMKAPKLFSAVVRAWVTGAPLPEELVPLDDR